MTNIIINTMINVLNNIMINDLWNNIKLQITTKAMINVASQIISIINETLKYESLKNHDARVGGCLGGRLQ